MQPPLNSPRGRNNFANSPSSEFKHIKPSMMSTAVEHSNLKKDTLNKNKHELRKLLSKLNKYDPLF